MSAIIFLNHYTRPVCLCACLPVCLSVWLLSLLPIMLSAACLTHSCAAHLIVVEQTFTDKSLLSGAANAAVAPL